MTNDSGSNIGRNSKIAGRNGGEAAKGVNRRILSNRLSEEMTMKKTGESWRNERSVNNTAIVAILAAVIINNESEGNQYCKHQRRGK